MAKKFEKLEDMKNLGSKTSERLRAVGVKTPAELVEMGAVEAYCRLKLTYTDSTSVIALIAIQGALMDVHWQEVPPVLSDALKLEAWELLKAQK